MREHIAKSINGIYIGTVLGSKAERASISEAIASLGRQLDSSLGRDGKYVTLNMSVRIRDGKVYEVSNNLEETYRP